MLYLFITGIELILLFIPAFLSYFGIFTCLEAILMTCIMIIVFFSSCYRKINFPTIKKNDVVNIIIAPEESASQFAFNFISKACKISEKHKNYRFLAYGTPSLTENLRTDTEIELLFDTSEDVIWGVPNLQQCVTFYIVYRRLANFILKNQNNIKNVIAYSSPDVVYRLYAHIKKRKKTNINLIATAIPEKEVISGKVGKQTIEILKNAQRVILMYSGGMFNEYYKKIAESYPDWDSDKIMRCQSSYVTSYLTDTKDVKVDLQKNSDIIILLGSRINEINYHINVAKFALTAINKINHDSLLKLNPVFLCPNNKIRKYLKEIFCKFQYASFELEKEYEYTKAKLAICKSGTSLIKPVLYGIPIIPFYLPNLRTKLYIHFLKLWRNKISKLDMNKSYILLPNLITKKSFLYSGFLGSINFNEFNRLFREYIKSPPDTEAFRIYFAKEFLEVKENYCSYSEIIEHYLKISRRNLVSIRQKLQEDAERDFNKEIQCEMDDIGNIEFGFRRKHSASAIIKIYNDRKVKLHDNAAVLVACYE